MTAVDIAPEQVRAPSPTAQGTAGDAASPQVLGRLARQVARPTTLKTQKKVLARLKASLAAVSAGDFEAGVQQALQALQLDERNGIAWHLIAICREKQGDLGSALSAYEAALQLLPEETDIAHDLGRLAQQLGYLDIAEKLLLKYLAAEPGHVEATNNLACVLRDQRRYGDAVEVLKPILAIEPEHAILWNTLGTVLTDQGEMATAMTFFEEALRLEPDFAKARYNRSAARHPLGDPLGALEDLDAALPGAETPYEAAMMRMARALLLMSLGRIPEGFEEYEARLDLHLPDSMRVVVDAPRWDPKTDSLSGKTLLIVGEQGLADEMVFGSIVGSAIEAVGPDGKVLLAVEARLVEMFQRSYPQALVGPHRAVRLEGRVTRYVPFAEAFVTDGGRIDVWTPMASLLAPFRPSLDAFPDTVGYLKPDPDRVAYWRGELDRMGPELKVGLHWKSLVLTGSRARYFSGFEAWRAVLETPGALMVNLQCGDVSEDLAQAEAAGLRLWTPPFDLKQDLNELAALSKALDVVIGPGIAGTNLAAAVGATTWMTTAPDDWHYLTTDGYPFYPQARMFPRTSFGDWSEVLARFRADLDAEIARRG